MPTRRDLHEANRASWNAATRVHNAHKRDQAAFMRGGGSTLFPEEIALLGDVRGRRLVHLQCNAGQDTLSLAARGAEAVGVDISDEAIDFATRLAADSGIAASFVRSDVYAWLDEAPRDAFDVAFTSYGALMWLSDLDTWARGVARILKPGGRLVVLEFHPLLAMLDEQGVARFPYFPSGATSFDAGVDDYVGATGPALAPSGFVEGAAAFVNPHPCHVFDHPLGETVTAIARAGLVVEEVVEYPFSNGCRFFPSMVPLEGNRFGMPEGTPQIPLMFGCVARKTEPPRQPGAR